MSRNMSGTAALMGSLVLLNIAGPVSAQWFSPFNQCRCYQPVAQARYQTVPVTEYRQIRQTVQRPVIETKYVDRTVTAYRPVVESRTETVPTVTWEDVTEQRTVYRDAGYWTTQYQSNPRISPCEYDSRPNVFGWMNRTGYAIRQSFTPRDIARRQYVPQVVVQNIPVTRRVARTGTRQVTYNVTRMVPYQTVQKIPVNNIRYVTQEIIRTLPVTVMRTVPIGTSIAYLPVVSGAPQTALLPTPDPAGSERSRDRTADRRNNESNGNEPPPQRFDRDSRRLDSDGGSASAPVRRSSTRSLRKTAERLNYPQARRATSTPSIVRVSRWVPRRRTDAGPSLISPSMTVAGAAR